MSISPRHISALLIVTVALCLRSGGAEPSTAESEAATALASGDLARAATLYSAAYENGDHKPATSVALARLILWQNRLDKAEKLARSIDSSAPEATAAAAVLKAIGTRHSDASSDLYRGIPDSTVTIPLLARDPLPCLVATINGREAGVLIDTGGDQLVTGPVPCRNFIRLVVGYALTCKMPLPAVSDTIEEARHQARKRGRTHIAAVDLRNALLNFRIPSDAALQRAFENPEKRRMASPSRVEAPAGAAHLQPRCSGVAKVLRYRVADQKDLSV